MLCRVRGWLEDLWISGDRPVRGVHGSHTASRLGVAGLSRAL